MNDVRMTSNEKIQCLTSTRYSDHRPLYLEASTLTSRPSQLALTNVQEFADKDIQGMISNQIVEGDKEEKDCM